VERRGLARRGVAAWRTSRTEKIFISMVLIRSGEEMVRSVAFLSAPSSDRRRACTGLSSDSSSRIAACASGDDEYLRLIELLLRMKVSHVAEREELTSYQVATISVRGEREREREREETSTESSSQS